MNDSILCARGLSMRFGRDTVLDGLDLDLARGEVTVLLGRNGSGKTTLMRLALGQLRPTHGEVRTLGVDPVRRGGAVRRAVGYVPAVPDVWPWMTPDDLLRFLRPQYPRWDAAAAAELLRTLDVPRRTPFPALSRGQGMKAMLVAAIAPQPDLLLLDEPFAGLDPVVRDEVLDGVLGALRGGRGVDTTVLCATHDLDVAARLADRIALLDGGRLAVHAPAEQVIAPSAGGATGALRGLLAERQEVVPC